MSIFSNNAAQPSPDPSPSTNSFQIRNFVRDAVKEVQNEERPHGNLGNYNNAVSLLSNYLNKGDSAISGPGKLSTMTEITSALDMNKQTGGLLDIPKWDYAAPGVRLAVAREAGLIDIYKDPNRRTPVPTFPASSTISLDQLNNTYHGALTDQGALKLAMAVTADYLSVKELTSKSFDDHQNEKKEAILGELRDFMKEALENGQIATFRELQEKAIQISDEFDQKHELFNSVIEAGDAVNTARGEFNRMLQSQQDDGMEKNLREWSAAQLLNAATDPLEHNATDRPALCQALIEKTAEVHVALNDLSRKSGLSSDELSLMDARFRIVDIVSMSTGNDGDEISIPATLLKDATDSYRTLTGKAFPN
jgi:hypothetical protein